MMMMSDGDDDRDGDDINDENDDKADMMIIAVGNGDSSKI